MKIVFMGTPEFARTSLQALIDDQHQLLGVFTQPDKPRGRGMQLSASPVKELALAHGIPVYQPVSLRSGEAESVLRELAPELIVTAAYGRILPEVLLSIPACGCINVHASLLPKYRGAAPIQWAVLNGDDTTGVTVQYMAEEMDAGDVISRKETVAEITVEGDGKDSQYSVKLPDGLLDLDVSVSSKSTAAKPEGKKTDITDYTDEQLAELGEELGNEIMKNENLMEFFESLQNINF